MFLEKIFSEVFVLASRSVRSGWPDTLVDAIGSLLDGTRNREQEPLRMHRYAMENFSERNYFHTVYGGINELIAAKCLSKIEQ